MGGGGGVGGGGGQRGRGLGGEGALLCMYEDSTC